MVGAFRQQLAAQFDDFRQVKVVPGGNGRTAEALIARVQPGAELDDNSIGMRLDEFLRLAVKDLRAATAADLRHDDVFEFAEVVVDLRQHPRRFGVGEQALVALLFDGFCPERDEQGFGEDGHVRGDFCGHYEPRELLQRLRIIYPVKKRGKGVYFSSIWR